jgi:hypothetical protein
MSPPSSESKNKPSKKQVANNVLPKKTELFNCIESSIFYLLTLYSPLKVN